MVAAEQRLLLLQGEGHVVGGVAGRVDGLDGDIGAGDRLTVLQPDVGTEGVIARRVELEPGGPAGGVRTKANRDGAGQGLEPCSERRVVAMGVGDEDVRNGPLADSGEERFEMCIVVRTGIDDGEFAHSHDEGRRAGEGEWAWIGADDAGDERRDLLRDAVRRIEIAVERERHEVVKGFQRPDLSGRRCSE